MLLNRPNALGCCSCVCGQPVLIAKVLRDFTGFYVMCVGKECWQGPVKPTEQEAIDAWETLQKRSPT